MPREALALTWSSADESSEGSDSMRASMSLALRAMTVANTRLCSIMSVMCKFFVVEVAHMPMWQLLPYQTYSQFSLLLLFLSLLLVQLLQLYIIIIFIIIKIFLTPYKQVLMSHPLQHAGNAVAESDVCGARVRETPHLEWVNCVKRALNEKGMTVKKARATVSDRDNSWVHENSMP